MVITWSGSLFLPCFWRKVYQPVRSRPLNREVHRSVLADVPPGPAVRSVTRVSWDGPISVVPTTTRKVSMCHLDGVRGSLGDQTTVRKYSSVLFNPSARSTTGFQPRSVCALVMSG